MRALYCKGLYLKPLFICNENFVIFLVPGEPVIVNVISKTNSLEVTWNSPTEPNGIIRTFQLCWMLSTGHNITCVSLNGGARWYEILNLSKWQRPLT